MKILGNSRGVATLLAAAIGLAVVPASAQTATPAKPVAAPPAAKPADPKALMASGQKKFKAADFADALADFEAANAAKASPETDRFIGLSHDSLGHFDQAVVAFERFLANVPPRMKAEGEETTKRVAAIKAMPGKVRIESTPAGAQITLDPASTPPPASAGTAPLELEVAPGHHTLRIAAEGHAPLDKEIDVAFASRQTVQVELVANEPPPPPPPPAVAEVPAPAPAPPAAPPPEPRSKVPAYVTGAVAIVAVGVGTGFGIKALSQSSDFGDQPTTKKADDGENNALIADMMFGIAITFGVTSAVLFLSNDAPDAAKAARTKNTTVATVKKPSRVTVIPAPYVTPSGGGAGALVRF